METRKIERVSCGLSSHAVARVSSAGKIDGAGVLFHGEFLGWSSRMLSNERRGNPTMGISKQARYSNPKLPFGPEDRIADPRVCVRVGD